MKLKSDRVSGEKNPMFGMVYITDGTVAGTKIVPKEDTIPEGFILGRFCGSDALFKVSDWLRVVNEAEIDLSRFGWKVKVCELLSISNFQAEKFFTFDRLGFEPYKKPQSSS